MITTELLDRLDAVKERLSRHANAVPPTGLTAPDPPTGERWDWGQVWAHIGEFVPYWIRQVRGSLAAAPGDRVPFGRVKSDLERVAAIERDRNLPAAEIMDGLEVHLRSLRTLIVQLEPSDWRRTVSHSTLGVMDMPRVFNEFLVGHLEQHADQLDDLDGAHG